MRVWVPKWVQRGVEENEAQTLRSGLSSDLGRGALEESPVGARIERTACRVGARPAWTRTRETGAPRRAAKRSPRPFTWTAETTPQLLLFLHQKPTPGRRSQAGGSRPRGPPQPPPRASSSILPGVQLNEARAGSNPISSPQCRRQPPAPAAIRTAPARAGVGQVKRDQFAPRLYQQVA